MKTVKSIDIWETVWGYVIVANDGKWNSYVHSYYKGEYTWYSDIISAKAFSLRSALMHYKRLCAQYGIPA